MSIWKIRNTTIMCVIISALIVATTTFSVVTLRGQVIVKEVAAAETTNTTNALASSNRSTITPSHVDSSPIVAVIIITKDKQGNLIFLPNASTIKSGEEILILNNDTKPHSVVNGMGPNDPLSGKLFDTGGVKPMAFIEYGASNLQQGKYPYYLTSEPNVKGELIVSAAGGK